MPFRRLPANRWVIRKLLLKRGPQRRRQADDNEVGLGGPEHSIVILVHDRGDRASSRRIRRGRGDGRAAARETDTCATSQPGVALLNESSTRLKQVSQSSSFCARKGQVVSRPSRPARCLLSSLVQTGNASDIPSRPSATHSQKQGPAAPRRHGGAGPARGAHIATPLRLSSGDPGSRCGSPHVCRAARGRVGGGEGREGRGGEATGQPTEEHGRRGRRGPAGGGKGRGGAGARRADKRENRKKEREGGRERPQETRHSEPRGPSRGGSIEHCRAGRASTLRRAFGGGGTRQREARRAGTYEHPPAGAHGCAGDTPAVHMSRPARGVTGRCSTGGRRAPLSGARPAIQAGGHQRGPGQRRSNVRAGARAARRAGQAGGAHQWSRGNIRQPHVAPPPRRAHLIRTDYPGRSERAPRLPLEYFERGDV